jgi:hypothetical protein
MGCFLKLSGGQIRPLGVKKQLVKKNSIIENQTHPAMITKSSSLFLVFLFGCIFSKNIYASPINIKVNEIIETRSTEKIFKKLNVTLKIDGEILKNAKGILPIAIKKAYCDSNTILKPFAGVSALNLFAFSTLDSDATLRQTLYLTAPERFNKKLFLEGEITAYKPKASSRVEVENFQAHTKKAINHKILKSNNVEIVFLAKQELEDFVLSAKGIEADARSNSKNVRDALREQFGKELAYLIENSDSRLLEEADIYFIISGNWKKVVSIEMLDATGMLIKNPGRSLLPDQDKIIFCLDYEDSLPPSAKVRIDIIQEGDTTTVPFQTEAELP